MKFTRLIIRLVFALIVPAATVAQAALPSPAEKMLPWEMPWGPGVPGPLSVAPLIERPAGRDGPVTVRDAHFFSGPRRLRFFGASIVFAAAFPTHAQADEVALRLARFGINAVRFHHIDYFPFPNGIFVDASREELSPAALDRLDYFIAALKSQGIYTDLNLHVSRDWARDHHWEGADQLPDYDKIVDLFHPELIAAQKHYARDLLTHVNAFTHNRNADEPAIAFLEINNEDSIFLWGGEEKLERLPAPYAGELRTLWNQWLVKKYASRDGLNTAWEKGAEPAGPELVRDPAFASIGPAGTWQFEQHQTARMNATSESSDGRKGVIVRVTDVDDISWHLQLEQNGLKVKKDQYYTLRLEARSDEPVEVTLVVNQNHEPWSELGLGQGLDLKKEWTPFRFGFRATADDANARACFLLGRKRGVLHFSNISLTTGGQLTLADAEDPARGTVQAGGRQRGDAPARARDWYDFLQQTDERFFVEMRRFLKDEIGVKYPIVGSIGLGALGTLSQSRMDVVDAHAYWDHPRFPHVQWDSRDWIVDNRPMVDYPAGATLWQLAATRVLGKPFTVTEYNHAAPNEWEAECLPMIASYAAAQDWDGIFLFDYNGDTDYRRSHTQNFFDIEGNPLKMASMPLASRLFLGGAVSPLRTSHVVTPTREEMLDNASRYFYEQWPFLRDTQYESWEGAFGNRFYLDLAPRHGVASANPPESPGGPTVNWTSAGPDSGTGRFTLADPHGVVFVGFSANAQPIELGSVRVEKMETPFATLILVPANPQQTIAGADRLLLSAVARGSNTEMKWDRARTSVADRWGSAPALVEVVHATLRIPGRPLKAFALTPSGQRGKPVPAKAGGDQTTIEIGSEPTVWYELVRQ